MLNHTFTFNGHSSDEFGIRIERFPDLNRSARKFKSASVPGRNGNIYQMEDAWEEVTVSYQIFAGKRTRGAAIDAFTAVMEWLHSTSDYAVLTDTYDPEHYRLAVFVDETDIESEWHQFGRATIKFRCRPERYLVTEELDNDDLKQSYSGNIVSFDTDVSVPIDSLTVDLEPIQAGSGDPSPTNVRPISGWDSVDVNVTGINVWGGQIMGNEIHSAINNESGSTLGTDADGDYVTLTASSYIYGKNLSPSIKFKENTQYSFVIRGKHSTTTKVLCIGIKYTDGSIGYCQRETTTVNELFNVSVLTASNKTIDCFVGLWPGGTTKIYYEHSGIFEGNVAVADYEPYNGNTTTVDLGQTVYGGTLNVTSGELTINKGYVDLGTLTWTKDTSTVSGKTIFRAPVSGSKSYFSAICSNYPFVGNFTNLYDKSCSYIYDTQIAVQDSSYTDATAFKTAMSGVQLVYELATPTTVQLTAQQINTLIGQNNVWSDGNVEVTRQPIIHNPTNHVAEPIITLTGSGAHSMMDLDKPVIDFNLSVTEWNQSMGTSWGWVDVDSTSLARKEILFYPAVSGTTLYTHDNTTGTIDFTTRASGSSYYGLGTGIFLTPNADYTISCTADGASTVSVLFFESSGNHYTSNLVENSISSAGTLELTFRVPSNCNRAVIFFTKTDGTRAVFSNIMLVSGTEAKPFKAYEADTLNSITIGDITLQFSANGFGDAVIDCERENIQIDGTDSNAGAVVVDQYGNLSAEYLNLPQGDSLVSYSEDITSLTIDPRFWEL